MKQKYNKNGLRYSSAARPLHTGMMYSELPFTTQEQILDDLIV